MVKGDGGFTEGLLLSFFVTSPRFDPSNRAPITDIAMLMYLERFPIIQFILYSEFYYYVNIKKLYMTYLNI